MPTSAGFEVFEHERQANCTRNRRLLYEGSLISVSRFQQTGFGSGKFYNPGLVTRQRRFGARTCFFNETHQRGANGHHL